MRKIFNFNDFHEHLRYQKADFSKPFALSLDCDQTLVDRTRGAHFLSPSTLDAFNSLKKQNKVKIIINTGRDLTAYEPLCKQLDHQAPCLFVSGRVLRWENTCCADPDALFSQSLKGLLWNAFKKGSLPFLDVKHAEGNLFFLKTLNDQAFIAPYRPADWFNEIDLSLVVGSGSYEEKCFFSLDIVRVDIPLFHHCCENTFKRLLQSNAEAAKEWILALLGSEAFSFPLTAIPVRTAPTRSELAPALTTIRLMVKNQHVNKGTGLKRFLKDFSIPETNLISCGDSNEETANDVIVKEVLPKSTLVIVEKATNDERVSEGDFILPPASEDGIVELLKAVRKLVL